MVDPAGVIRNAGILMRAAARPAMPLVISKQYPQGLGTTVPELRALAPDSARVAKVSFSCAADRGLLRRVKNVQRSLIVRRPGGACLRPAVGARLPAGRLSDRGGGGRHFLAGAGQPRHRLAAAARERSRSGDDRDGAVQVARPGRYAGVQGAEQADQVVGHGVTGCGLSILIDRPHVQRGPR